MRCNRCTSVFDHHCKFVNNCVGESNYKDFLKLIFFLEIFEIIVLGICVSYFSRNYMKLGYGDIPVIIVMCKSIITLLANGYLIGFHIYINAKKITTFEYITLKSEKKFIFRKINPDEQSFSMIKENNINNTHLA